MADHVTGLLMQVRMPQMIRTAGPDQPARLLYGAEHGATEALASMHRTVGVLRASFDETAAGQTADHRLSDMATLPELVERLAGTRGPKAVLHRGPSVPTICHATSRSPPIAS